ncbi:MAG: DUF3465 domain-containing protein [Methylovulum sp.]|nr:DUF3465 domain-containing protein [Methylovulum sp.]
MKIFLRLVLIGLILVCPSVDATATATPQQEQALVKTSDWILKQAFLNKKSGLQVRGGGVVSSVLGDDTVGERHQRFILRLASGQTLLITHNIGIALRLMGLQPGDAVKFYGQYEWNDRGGLVHWTHHDPNGQHINGWLKYRGKIYR